MAPSLDHPALVYQTVEEFLERMVPFVVQGAERDEPVFVAVGPGELDALRAEVGEREPVHWRDTTQWHPHPGTRLGAFHVFVTDAVRAGAGRIRLVGEPLWPDDPPGLAREWARYESALNTALAPFPVTVVCTYDASRLAPDVLDDAARTHPTLGVGTGSRPSEAYVEPASLVARWTDPLAPPPPEAEVLPGPVDLGGARAFAGDLVRRSGGSPGSAHDLQLAVNEIVTNALVHGDGDATVWAWVDDGSVVCQIDDHGPGVADALAGYRPPRPDQLRGRGLWLTRQVVDLLEIVPTSSGTSVRVRVRIDR
ncbi:MAG TPA: sensor histidine kinase [Actinomycetota bacterium]|nr:sensor histidine kinase [Actinomycetota bacterium]